MDQLKCSLPKNVTTFHGKEDEIITDCRFLFIYLYRFILQQVCFIYCITVITLNFGAQHRMN